MEEVGDRLRVLRLAMEESQKVMASMAGLQTKQAWTKYESGAIMPDPWKMVAICARCRVSMAYIYSGTLFGVHPGIGQKLVARMPSLVQNTTRSLHNMGISQASGTAPTWRLPLE
jgi:transcriptional regulator with XRE-family HTH domain